MISPFWNKKRVFLTGHTGFKGSWLSLWLTQMGANVMGYSLQPPTQPSLFKLCNLESKLQSILGDVRDFPLLQKTMISFQPEIVIHMAAQALVRPSYQDPIGTYSTNVMGTVHLLEAARHIPSVRAILNVTSDKCYENKEWTWGYRENEPMGGWDPYSSSKGCAELVTAAYRRSYSIPPIASSRAGNVIGGGDWATDRLIPDCIRALLENKPITIRNPNAIRPWQHVLEPLSGYLSLIEQLWNPSNNAPHPFAEGWNFGPDFQDARPVRWIADHIVQLWGPSARWELTQENQVHEAHALKLDCSQAQTKLKWRPALPLHQALEWVIDWYKDYQQNKDMFEKTSQQIRDYSLLRENL